VGKESDPYYLFVFADQTREKYITRLKKFLEIIGIDQEKKLTIQERCKIFAEGRVSGRMGGKHNYSVSSIRRQSAYCHLSFFLMAHILMNRQIQRLQKKLGLRHKRRCPFMI
jgi:hypothetical protein